MSNGSHHELLSEALKWLDQELLELSVWPNGKFGEDILDGLEKRILLYNAELRGAIDNALGLWVTGDEPLKASYGVSLLVRLRARAELPALRTLRTELFSGTKASPYLSLEAVDNAISSLT